MSIPETFEPDSTFHPSQEEEIKSEGYGIQKRLKRSRVKVSPHPP
jgi:hypothetical protein